MRSQSTGFFSRSKNVQDVLFALLICGSSFTFLGAGPLFLPVVLIGEAVLSKAVREFRKARKEETTEKNNNEIKEIITAHGLRHTNKEFKEEKNYIPVISPILSAVNVDIRKEDTPCSFIKRNVSKLLSFSVFNFSNKDNIITPHSPKDSKPYRANRTISG